MKRAKSKFWFEIYFVSVYNILHWAYYELLGKHVNKNHHTLNRDDGSDLPQKYISTLLVNDVTSWVHKQPRCDFVLPMMKTLDWSVETVGRECNSTGLCIHFYKTRVASETWLVICLVAVNVETLHLKNMY